MKLVNEFCRPMSPVAIAIAEARLFTTYSKGYAQEIQLERGDPEKYIPRTGIFFADRTPLPPGFLEEGETVEYSGHLYQYDPVTPIQRTHCPYPVDLLPQSSVHCLLPPPIFEGQFIRHNVYNFNAARRACREYVSVRIGEHLEWLLLSEWTLDKS